MNMTTNQMTLRELLSRFPDEATCKAFLAKKRWPDGVVKCPRCGAKAYTLKARPFHYLCKSGAESVDKKTGEAFVCSKTNGYRFSVITRTVFENTNYPLREWFTVIFLMFSSKKGMSALQIHRMIGSGSYETAWYMCTRIRSAMRGDVLPLEGEVEADETYIGGKESNKHWNKRVGKRGAYAMKTPVIGVIARKGNVICQAVNELGFTTQEDFVRKAISDKVTLVATDEHAGYRNLRKHGLPHQQVNHSEKQYVVGSVHTNTIENFWSLLKRGIIGNYHHVSREYLPLYLNEFSFRFNNRKNPDIFDAIIAGC
jgi:transposase-like protein